MFKKSLFITFEGGEGAGKSSLISRLDVELKERGYKTLVTREPGGSPLGEKIRQLLLNHDFEIVPYAEMLLFLAARAQHVEQVIKPALSKGEIVLCDRFNDSTVAYQGHARGLGEETVKNLCHLATGGLAPTLTFYLDLDPEVGMQRALKQQRVMDRMEREQSDFHSKVRQGFLNIANSEKSRVVVIDASQAQEKVFTQVFGRIKSKLQE